MHRRGIGRIDLERNLQQFTKGTVGAFQAQGNQINTLVGKFTWYLRYTWIAVGFISIWLGALTGHLLGWW